MPLLALTVAAVSLTDCSVDMQIGNSRSDAYNPDTDSNYTDGTLPEPFGGRFAEDFVSQVMLTDGRKVRLWSAEAGTELMEQRSSPGADTWTVPQTIYVSDEQDPCQGIGIVEEGGLVAAYADFASFCYGTQREAGWTTRLVADLRC